MTSKVTKRIFNASEIGIFSLQDELRKWYREYYSKNREAERKRYRDYYAANSEAEKTLYHCRFE